MRFKLTKIFPLKLQDCSFNREPIKNRLWIVEENIIRIRGENDYIE